MSGVEIVGLILGAIPLIISALENYKEGIDVISDFRNYRSTLKSLKTKLSIQEELYRGTLERLISSELSPLEVRVLFPDPGTGESKALWGTHDIEDKLRRKLGTKFDVFMDVIAEMNEIMEKLMEKLDIDMNGKPKWKPRLTADARIQDRFAWEWRRIRRSLGKAEREELISKFERYNNNLASFVHNREILAPHSDERGKVFVKYLDLVRNQACGLHSILGNSWKCTCNTPHKAYLRLQHPSEASFSPPTFGVTFPSHQMSIVESEADEQESTFWNHTFISISKLDNKPEASATEICSSVPLSTPTSQTPHKTLRFGSSLKVASSGKKTSRVQFSSQTQLDMSASTQISLALLAGPPPLQTIIRSTTISLCSAVSTKMPAEKILGSFLNTTENEVALITTDMSQKISKPLCLNMLLSKSVDPPQHCKLSDKDRLKIALTLASTLLQLYDSPWIDNAWSGQDIQFISSQSANNYEAPLIGPFVSTSFGGPASASDPQPLAATSSPLVDSLMSGKVLVPLAIMLIELCLDKTLMELRQHRPGEEETGAQKKTLLDDYETAQEQLEAVYQKSGSNYGDVVERCLKCTFSITPKQRQLSFEKFRYLVYEGVVAPLEENYRRYLVFRGD